MGYVRRKMEKIKKILNRIFIDGLGGMALGLFSTLIIGTIIAQIGTFIGGDIGSYINGAANVAKTLTVPASALELQLSLAQVLLLR